MTWLTCKAGLQYRGSKVYGTVSDGRCKRDVELGIKMRSSILQKNMCRMEERILNLKLGLDNF